MNSTIVISEEVKTLLKKMRGYKRETYNEIIMNLIEDNMCINEKTKKELDSSRFNKEKTISHEEVKKRLNF